MRVSKKIKAIKKMVDKAEHKPFPFLMMDGERTMGTDGRMLVVVDHIENDIGDDIQKTVEVHTDALEVLDSQLAKGEAVVNRDVLPKMREGRSIRSLVAMASKGQSPARVKAEVAFDLERLIELAKVLYAGEGKKKRQVVKLTVYEGDTTALKVETSIAEIKATAILAPCKL